MEENREVAKPDTSASREPALWEYFIAPSGEWSFKDYFFKSKGESEPSFSEYFFEPAKKEVGKASTEGWLFRDGTVEGVILMALAGGLIGMKELGEIWKKYGRENFPLDPFTERGRTAMKKQYHELKNALAQIGR